MEGTHESAFQESGVTTALHSRPVNTTQIYALHGKGNVDKPRYKFLYPFITSDPLAMEVTSSIVDPRISLTPTIAASVEDWSNKA
jgi:hypothetical protein